VVIPITNIYSSFIDEADCGNVSCAIKAAGCRSAFKPKNGEITMDSSSFAITLKQNIEAGFKASVCIVCQSDS
jgi:hypothetical protein